MRILILSREFYPFVRPSGVTTLIKNLIETIQNKSDHEIRLICKRKPNEQAYYDYNGIKIVKHGRLFFRELITEIKSYNPTYILIISSMVDDLGLIWWLLWTFFTPKKTKILFYQATVVKSFTSNLITKLLANKVDRFYACSEKISLQLKNVTNKNVDMVLPSFKSPFKIFKSDIQKRFLAKKILYLGHLAHIKGVDVILKIAEKNPNITFDIVAGLSKTKEDEMYADELIQTIEKTDNVNYYGFVEDPLRFLNESSFLILPYRSDSTILGVSQSAVESLHLGVPVLGTKTSVLEDIIKEGESGYFFDISDLDSLNIKIEKLFSNQLHYSNMAECSLSLANQKFSHDNFNKFIELFNAEQK